MGVVGVPEAGRGTQGRRERGAGRSQHNLRSPDGAAAGAYEALVEACGSVMTLASSGTDPLEEATQYRVTRLEKVY